MKCGPTACYTASSLGYRHDKNSFKIVGRGAPASVRTAKQIPVLLMLGSQLQYIQRKCYRRPGIAQARPCEAGDSVAA